MGLAGARDVALRVEDQHRRALVARQEGEPPVARAAGHLQRARAGADQLEPGRAGEAGEILRAVEPGADRELQRRDRRHMRAPLEAHAGDEIALAAGEVPEEGAPGEAAAGQLDVERDQQVRHHGRRRRARALDRVVEARTAGPVGPRRGARAAARIGLAERHDAADRERGRRRLGPGPDEGERRGCERGRERGPARLPAPAIQPVDAMPRNQRSSPTVDFAHARRLGGLRDDSVARPGPEFVRHPVGLPPARRRRPGVIGRFAVQRPFIMTNPGKWHTTDR